MKANFDFKRFGNLIHLFCVENAKSIGLLFTLCFVVLVLVLDFFASIPAPYYPVRYAVLFVYLIISMSIVFGITSQSFKKKTTLSNYILLPNSALEKTLMYVFIYGIAMMFIAVTLFVVADYLVVNNWIPRIDIPKLTPQNYVFKTYSSIPFDKNVFSIISIIGFFYFTGGFTHFIVSRKIKALLGLMMIGLIIGISTLLNYVMFIGIPLKNLATAPFGRVTIHNEYSGWKNNYYLLVGDLSDTVFYGGFVIPMCLLGVAIYYFKLKEKEI